MRLCPYLAGVLYVFCFVSASENKYIRGKTREGHTVKNQIAYAFIGARLLGSACFARSVRFRAIIDLRVQRVCALLWCLLS